MSAVLIKNGLVYDGTGVPPKKTDILVQRSRVARLGDFGRREAERVIDATGAIVVPGLIEVGFEAEASDELLSVEAGRYFLRRGVTTVLDGTDGSSLAPLIAPLRNANHDWFTLEEFWRTIEARRTAINLGVLVGYAELRRSFTEGRARDLDMREMGQLVAIIKKAFRAGALGIGLGDVEMPRFSEWEVLTLAEEASRAKRVLAAHLSGGEGTFGDALAKIIAAAKKSGASIELSHFEPRSQDSAAFKSALGAIEKQSARANINFDVFPAPLARIPFAALLPSWFPSDSREETLADLRALHAKDRLLAHFKKLPLADLRIASVPRHLKFLKGKRLGDLASNWGTRPERAILRLAAITGLECRFFEPRVDRDILEEAVLSARSMFTASFHEAEEDLKGLIASASCGGKLPLEQIVAKLTSVPAKKFGLTRRGSIAPDHFADLVILRDFRVQTVFVNGAPAFEDGVFAPQMVGAAVRAGE
ncbi:amidohydrolase family protein [Patescibacteria group bacterium]|nr:amidohydrolase family protein [Patescibacteria group bacterium]